MKQKFTAAGVLAFTALLGFFAVPVERLAHADAVPPGTMEQGPSASRSTANRDYYPAKAKRLELTGRVGLAYSVNGDGKAANIQILESGGPLFDEGATHLLSDLHFDVPPDWMAKGGPAKRFQLGVIFQMTGKPKVSPFEDNRRTVIVTVPGLPGG